MTARCFVNARSLLILVVGWSVLSLSVRAADPSAAADAHSVPASSTNLQVLPKDISASALKGLMDRYDAALGVSCDYCHVLDPQTQRFDYASDDNPKKMTARVMISMLETINGKFLSQLGDPRYPVRLGCGNCHQGREDPPAFEPGAAMALRAR